MTIDSTIAHRNRIANHSREPVPSGQTNPPTVCPAALTVSEIASLLGVSEASIVDLMSRRLAFVRQELFSIGELAERWRCSRGSVYNRLRAAGAKVLDFAAPGKRGKKAVPASVVMEIEARYTRRLR